MKCLCVIPARGGSKRLPGKNIRPFLGEPIIYRPIRAARESGLFEDVVVSTDSQEIADTVCHVATVAWRDPALCRDDATDLDVVRDIQEDHYSIDDYLCYLYPTAALVTVEQIQHGLDLLIRSTRAKLYCTYDDLDRDAGQFSWYDLWQLIGNEEIDQMTITMPVSHWEAQDINTLEDFELAEMKARWKA